MLSLLGIIDSKEKTRAKRASTEATIRKIRRKTKRNYSAEEKVRIVLKGLGGDQTIAELCRREGISQNLYYRWSKEFLNVGKARLAGNSKRQANSGEVEDLERENEQLKQLVAELALRNNV